MALNPRERAVLELCDGHYRYEAIREEHARRMSLSPGQLWQQAHVLVARPDALEQDAALVMRIQRKFEQRAARRRAEVG